VQRILLGICAVVLVFGALLAFSALQGEEGASAVGPTPTKIANDGSLGGVVDILVHTGTETVAIAHCIGKVDHATSNNAIKTAQQCSVDTPGVGTNPNAPPSWADLVNNPSLQIPGENPDSIPGPPVPPPYTLGEPVKSYGALYPSGDPTCDALIAGQGPTDPCVIETTCYPNAGAVIGPNVMTRVYMGDPLDVGAGGQTSGDGKTRGVSDYWYNQAGSSCKAGIPKGSPNFNALPTTYWRVHDKGGTPGTSAPWRSNTYDFDGDGCTDEDELDKTGVANCGDDPFNPTDSFDPNTVDLDGAYTIGLLEAQADCSNAQACLSTLVPGSFGHCRSYLDHNTSTDDVSVRLYCYKDEPGSEINAEAFPGISGDGHVGAPPPGPETTFGNGEYAFGDIGTAHTELTGTFDTGTSVISVEGCFEDEDGYAPDGNVFWSASLDGHQGFGSVDVYEGQTLTNCQNGTPSGGPTTVTTSFVMQPGGTLRHSDRDGMADARELADSCLRDPLNQFDFYDIDIPRNGSVTAPDVFSVLSNYAPYGYTDPADANFDRSPTLLGGAAHWSRGGPDGVIDLPNDVLGASLQFPTSTSSCPASGPAPLAPTTGGEMDLSVTNGSFACPPSIDPDHACVLAGESFVVSANTVQFPAGGYELAQAWLDYGNDLAFTSSQATWPNCFVGNLPNEFISLKGSNHTHLGCITGFGGSPTASTHLGSLFEFTLFCPGYTVSTDLELIPAGTNPADTAGSMFVQAATHRQFVPDVNPLTVECIEDGSMAVDAIGDSTSPGDPVDVKRTVPVGEPFLITAHVTTPPDAGIGGYSAYRAEVRWDESYLDYNTQPVAAENAWPETCNTAKSTGPDDDTGNDAFVSIACVSAPTVSSAYTGPVVQLEFVCHEVGPAQLSLTTLAQDPTNGTMLVDALGGQLSSSVTNASVNCSAPDSDSDGIPDWFEDLHSSCLNKNNNADAATDGDSDGQTALSEFAALSDPCDPDTDDDGLNDGLELKTHFTSPLTPDTDWDGLSDASEINTHGTNPISADSDSDGLNDAFELILGLDPTDSDTDTDTYGDGLEVAFGSDANLNSSTPEHSAIGNTCNDTIDNDGDTATDDDDTDCPGLPPAEVDVETSFTSSGGIPQAIRNTPITIDYTPTLPAGTVTITITGTNSTIGPVTMMNVNANGTLWRYTFTPPSKWFGDMTIVITDDSQPIDDFAIKLIDPSGNIYDDDTLDLIEGATVQLFYENPATNEFVLVDPDLHGGMFRPEVNPLVTGENGRYAWDVAAGDYFVRVSKPGCSTEDSIVVTIPPEVTDLDVGLDCPDTDGDGVKDHIEIELGTSYIDKDHDDDGCEEGKELGLNPADGGLRDPVDPWDYYDVLGPGGSPTHDGVIDLANDILGVILHFSPSGNPPYDVRFDRGPTVGANHWERAAPDGAIDLPNDILGVILQFTHNCA